MKVLDGDGNPVAGASVTFALTASTAASAAARAPAPAAARRAGASFAGGASEASATSNADGIATSPALTANGATGTFAASAALGSSGASEPHGGDASTGSLAPALFALANLAGAPAKLTPESVLRSPRAWAPASRSASRSPSPTPGQSRPRHARDVRRTLRGGQRTLHRPGRVAVAPAGAHAPGARASVRTNACGIALAPAYTANREPGGYMVEASAGHARAAAFALVNEVP